MQDIEITIFSAKYPTRKQGLDIFKKILFWLIFCKSKNNLRNENLG